MTSQEIMLRQRAAVESHIFGVLKRSILVALKSDALTVFRVKMSSRFQKFVCAVLVSAPFWLPVSASAQQDMDPELRIERLENQLRTLTGQNEELQYRNRQLEEQLRALQGAQPQPNQAAAPRPASPNVAAPQVQQNPNAGYQQPSVVGEAPPVIAAPVASSGRRGDAFDPSRNPNAPGVSRSGGMMNAGGLSPISNARISKAARWRAKVSKSRGSRTPSNSSSCKFRGRAAFADRTETSCGSAMPGRTGANMPGLARSCANAG